MGGGSIVAMASTDALENLDINVTVVPKMALFIALLAPHVFVGAARSRAGRAASPAHGQQAGA